jgi:hypothetical protein
MSTETTSPGASGASAVAGTIWRSTLSLRQ